ncbi:MULTISPECIES: alpha/beta fold hydrolase [unclassified Embleya]|uniref:alpha/beta fold hydrolase n=1 Tax=unclassified Embleya TaxID=2699296 RepID=UPI003402FEB7
MRLRQPLAVTTYPSAERSEQPPVLLVHGFCSSARRTWLETGLVQALLDAGHTLLAPDLRGHGASPAPTSAAEVDAVASAQDLLAVVDAYGADRFDVLAYSLGARLVWELAELAPDRIGRVVLGGLSPTEPFAAVDVPELRRAVHDEAHPPADPLTGMIAGLIRAEGARADGLVTCVEGLRSTPFAPKAWAGGTPPWFLVGADDLMVHGSEELVALVPGAQLVCMAGDHHGVLVNPYFGEVALRVLHR